MKKWIRKYVEWVEGLDNDKHNILDGYYNAKNYLYIFPLFILLLIATIFLMTL
ncbi:MAG: hypothetical protein R3279_01415 [Putridiphycobacter sp.]|nr:hypothetical protein [Putridiphycobacter sp.]